jgi:hypothetical protein
VRTAYTEEVEHGALGLENRAATHRTHLDRGHGDGDLKVTIVALHLLAYGVI